MIIVVAPDSFKECLTATEVATNISKGILKVMPDAKISSIPISDGGEGLLESLVLPFGGKIHSIKVKDPLQRVMNSEYGILKDGRTAVIEMAKASGLELLKDEEKNPLITTTFGTGQLIKDALNKGCTKLIIGLGGSATNDGGVGMLKALGVKFLKKNGENLEEGGCNLNELHRIDIDGLDNRIENCEILVACDVSNPLTGPTGASYIYGAQKGGNVNTLKILDENLKIYANILESMVGKNIDVISGAGAAGGTGAGLLAFMNAKLVNGIELILETLHVEKYIKEADLVITGEGKIDQQTLNGKTIVGIAKMSKKYDVPVIVLTGKIDDGIDEIYKLGVNGIYSIVNQPMNLSEALKNAAVLIENCTENIMRTIKSFKDTI